MKKKPVDEIHLQGLSISRGIAIGKAFVFEQREDAVPHFTIGEGEVEAEIKRYRAAVEISRAEVSKLSRNLEIEKAPEGVAILESYQQIMQDPLLTREVEDNIRSKKKNAEAIFHAVMNQYQKKFGKIADPFFSEKAKDLQDITSRILGSLLNRANKTFADIPPDSIIFAADFTPSAVAEANRLSALALIAKGGSSTSHAAIVAKAKGIPYVANIDYDKINIRTGTLIIVDGRTGDIIVNPTEKTLQHYRSLLENYHSRMHKLEKTSHFQAETYDGYCIRISANIDMMDETDSLHRYGGSGVGLFRSENVILGNDRLPGEEEQYHVYRRIVEEMKGLPIVIRTFDIGADQRWLVAEESNPYLGCRAIRFLLKEQEIFKDQLRAILRASVYGDVSIMFPMISSLSELLEAKQLLNEVMEELKNDRGLKLKPIRIGSMIEVPSAAIISDLLAKECDFLSIGTNDLVQYALAVDRDNHMMNNLYTPTHPSVIRLIKLVVSEANRHGIPVTVCGEVASDPKFTPLLLGLGVHELSVASRFIPSVKNAIRHTSILAASHLAEHVMKLSTASEIEELLIREYQKHAPEDCVYRN